MRVAAPRAEAASVAEATAAATGSAAMIWEEAATVRAGWAVVVAVVVRAEAAREAEAAATAETTVIDAMAAESVAVKVAVE